MKKTFLVLTTFLFLFCSFSVFRTFAQESENINVSGQTQTSKSPPNQAGKVIKTQKTLPSGLVDLPLKGFHSSVFVAPSRTDAPPWPLVVILHGNYDRPEWECQTWMNVGKKQGWLLCPRGIPRTDIPKALDRWYYRGRQNLAKEVKLGVSELEKLYPGLVSRDEAVLVGLSLGANMSPRFAGMGIMDFKHLILIEGGYQVTLSIAKTAARKGVKSAVYLCGENTPCSKRTPRLQRIWKRAGVQSATFVMPGVGHGYPANFDPIAEKAFDFLGLPSHSQPSP